MKGVSLPGLAAPALLGALALLGAPSCGGSTGDDPKPKQPHYCETLTNEADCCAAIPETCEWLSALPNFPARCVTHFDDCLGLKKDCTTYCLRHSAPPSCGRPQALENPLFGVCTDRCPEGWKSSSKTAKTGRVIKYCNPPP